MLVVRFCSVFMATLILCSSMAWAQGGRGAGGFGFGGPLSLLQMEDVRKELGITEEQQAKVRKLQDDSRPTRPAGGENPRDLSPEKREELMAEFRKQAAERSEKQDAELKKILDEKQLKRLGELRNQQDGVRALSRADVVKGLGLTDDQQKKIKELSDSLRPSFGGTRGGQDQSADDRRTAMEEARKKREKAEADILAVLTPEQKTNWEKMQGEKFKFPERTFGPGAGGGRTRPNSSTN